jgi:hypothetical protein
MPDSDSLLSMILSDLPSPADASSRNDELHQDFAQAGNGSQDHARNNMPANLITIAWLAWAG